MLLATVEEQAKLGVSAEQSKAHRLQRQQARFRDRGGAFVASNTNPLVDILLARTVSGESPPKPRAKDAASKPSKSRRTSTSDAVARSSKSKPTPRKRKEKAVVTQEDETVTKPAPKRRGRPAKSKPKAPDSDTEQAPSNTKSKSTSKGKGKQRDTNTAPSTSDAKPKAKAKAKSQVVLVSDDDQTLVDVPHKPKPKSKRNVQYEDDVETDDDPPVVKRRIFPQTNDSQTSGTKTATRTKVEKENIVGVASSGSGKTIRDGDTTECLKTNTKKRMVSRGEGEDDGATAPLAKKGKTAKSKATSNEKGMDKTGTEEEDDDEPPAERTSKLKKRKKEDNYDDRPRKTVKFSGTGHPSSQKLKENQSDSGRKSVSKSSATDKTDAPLQELATTTTRPPSRAKSKGPPPKVLERIKASAARHLRCADSEPDELDCLS